MKTLLAMLIVSSGLLPAQSQVTVTVSPPRIIGQKAVVPLALTNGFAEKVESARAVVFLLDGQGKMLAPE